MLYRFFHRIKMYFYFSSIVFFFILETTHGNSENDSYNEILHTILAGGRAQRNQFPYQVSLQKYSDKFYFYHFCSGAILSEKWVVTTGYCATPVNMRMRVVAGTHLKHDFHPDVQTVDVANVVLHPNYHRGISENDIALLELNAFLVLTPAVQPIEIPRDKEYSHEIWGAAMLSGWNVQTQVSKPFSLDSLQYLIVYIMEKEDCDRVLRSSIIFSEKMLCTENITESFYCPGESGAPLVCEEYLVGITSWGLKPCGVTMYTKISAYVDFILEYVDLDF